MTPLEFVKREFPNLEELNISHDVWLRKMHEFTILKSQDVDLGHILNLPTEVKKALEVAAGAICSEGKSGYQNALYAVVRYLSGVEWHDLEDNVVEAIYNLLQNEWAWKSSQ